MTFNGGLVSEIIKMRINREATKKAMREHYLSRLTVAYNGGLFVLKPELFAMLQLFSDESSVVLVDSFDNPILISDLGDFTKKCKQRYTEVSNKWHADYEQSKRDRKI
jgi:hypothetical protein